MRKTGERRKEMAYQAKDYTAAFFKNINWEIVEKRLG